MKKLIADALKELKDKQQQISIFDLLEIEDIVVKVRRKKWIVKL